MSSLSSDLRSIFDADGRLARMAGMEVRPQQLAMAEGIADALQTGRHLLVEAPTGVGKSLAYIIPAILFSVAAKRRAVICTHTKNLQEQLITKDIPLARSLMKVDFTAVTLKGRRNYLCTTRLNGALSSQRSLFDTNERDELLKLSAWAETSDDGDLEHLPFPVSANVWSQVTSEPGTCSSRLCGTSCFFQKAKIAAREATVVVMNHALFFTLLAIQKREGQFLYDGDFAIFDEAHTLEQIAGVGVGKSISRNQVVFAIHRIYNPRTKKGLVGGRVANVKGVKELRTACTDAFRTVEEFFADIDRASRNVGKPSNVTRVTVPNVVADTVTRTLQLLQTGAKELEKLESKTIRKDELAAARRLLWEAEILIGEFLAIKDPRLTYWIERGSGRSQNTVLHTAPTSVAESVGPILFQDGPSVIMTSATLTVNGSPAYVQNRLGATTAESLILDTPFDLRRQMRISLDAGMPAPDDPAYSQALPAAIMKSVRRSNGKALVLFTSARLLKEVAATLAQEFEEAGITLLVQDGRTPRGLLLDTFRSDVDSVLFGLDSFWMGVDVPGEALEHVIITRLPFAVPDHPLVEARMELIAKNGGNTFMEYQLPEAILKLRQGIGRLIRSSSDKGEITILDSRILKKQYGWVIVRSLPRCPVRIMQPDGSTEDVEVQE